VAEFDNNPDLTSGIRQLDPDRLVSAVEKVTRLNQLLEAVDSNGSYVPLKQRIEFICCAMAALQGACFSTR
jgi:hypothetical protein